MKIKRILFQMINLLVIFTMTLASPMSAMAAVWTDQADYTPGSVVTISGDNSDGAGYLPGETVHVDVLGPNEYAAACEGVAGDSGAWSCQVTLWDSLLAVGTYAYTATGLQSLVSQSGTFTDASGDFSLDFVAAAPYSYNHLTGGGAYDDRTVGTTKDIVESLEGGDFACGDIVTYFVAVTVDNTASADADAPQTIELDFSFLADTTGQSGAALGDIVYVGVNYGTIQDLIPDENTVDDGILNDDSGSTATLVNEHLDGTIFVDGVLYGTVVLSDLERNEQVIVRIDVKLFCQPGSDPTGNLQADLQAARLTYIHGSTEVIPPKAIPGGAQTVPFKQIGNMVAPALDVQKTVTTGDGTCPGGETLTIYAGETVKYCYVVTNPSNTTNPPGAPLYNVFLVDDNGTPADTGDDFPVTLTGLTDLDMDGAADDLAAGGTAYGGALVSLSIEGTVVNTAMATGYDAIVFPTPYTDTDTAAVTVEPPPVVAPMPRVIKGNEEGNDTVATLDEPGGPVTINVVVYNDAPAGTGDATLISLSDDIYGDITTTGHDGITATTCVTGSAIAGGSSYTCSFSADITSEPATIVDTLTAVLQNTHSSVSDSDQANVVISDLMPAVELVKDVTPATLPEPGGVFTYTLTVYNTSSEPVTITALTDDNPLPVECIGLVGQTIAAGESLPCTYTVVQTVPGTYPNTASVTVEDNEGNPASDTDSETVTVTDVMPVVDLTKTADPLSLPEPGGVFTFTLSIHNTSVEAVTITVLTDENALSAGCLALVGTSIPAGGTVSCTYTVSHTEAGSYPNTASVTVEDNEGNPASDTDSETVIVTDVMPVVDLTKMADPLSLPEPGGVFTFTLSIHNTSVEAVTITALTDENALSAGCLALVGTSIPAGGTVSCTYTVSHTEAGSYPNTASVTVADNEGNPATDTDDETVTVTDVAPLIRITKTADPTHVPETGGNVVFTFLVENIGAEAVTLTSLNDTVFGDLNGKGDCATGGLIPVDGSYTCSITMYLSSDSLAEHYNVATAVGTDNEGSTATDDDDETVTFDDVAPQIRITKTADPTHVPETGGNVTFTFLVENIGQEDVTLTSLTDTVFGNLNGKGTCAVPQAVLIGGSYSCAYTVFLASDSLTAHYNVSTATAVDDDDTPATDDDDEAVTFDDVLPDIMVTKTASPTQVPETGGNVIFTFLVKNNGQEAVVIAALLDSVYGVLGGDEDCMVGATLAAGASCEFAITRWVEGDYSGPDHINIFTSRAADNDGNEDTATDDATVDFTNVLPVIEVTKMANPTVVLETGGSVTFSFTVKNTSSEEPVTITSLVDSVYNTLAGDDDCQVGTVLAAGASCEFSITKWVAGDYGGSSHVNVFTAKAVDNDNTEASDDDDAMVDFSDAMPDIAVTKAAAPTSIPEPGANVTFTFTVKNNGPESATITSLSDSVFGVLAGDADCMVGTVLAAGASCEFSITRMISGNAGFVHANMITVQASDDDGNTDTATDDAAVTITDVMPSIQVDKTASKTSVIYTGEMVTYTIKVTNTSVEPVILSALVDDKFGDLEKDTLAPHTWLTSTCDLPQTLNVGASYTCTITAYLSTVLVPLENASHTNTVTGTAHDDEGNAATDTGSATVKFYWRGRTPGYWKNHSKQWPASFFFTNYKGQALIIKTSTPVLSVFNVPQSLQKCTLTGCFLDLNKDKKNDTLIQALAYQGGDDLAGKAQILLRAAVAAMLNEKTFGTSYPPYNSVEDLVAAVNATLATLNEQAFVDMARQLDWWNNGVE